MSTIEQSAALEPDRLGARDRARFFRAGRHDRLEGLTAAFRAHRYAPHSHETYVVGVIVAGCEAFQLRGARRLAAAGDVCFVHPGDVHDGEPAGEGYAYRMTYPSIGLMQEIAADLTDRDVAPAPFFADPVLRDPDAYAAFVAAHRALEAEPDGLLGEEALVSAYALLVARHAGVAPMDAARGTGPAIGRARDFLDAHFAEEIDLARLANVAGLSRHHFLRRFKHETGLTPHAYLTDCRVRAARRLVAAGEPLAEVAAACGFFDQSHLSNAFKARVGVAPGAFRRG